MASGLRGIKSFTLVELLIVIAILAVLAAAVVIVLNPGEMLAQARDSQRVTDLQTLNKSINIVKTQDAAANFGLANVIYISIPDTSATCANITGLPTLPAGWTYNCVTTANLRNTNGTGWLPVDFNSFAASASLPYLPIDPTNTSASGRYYTYTSDGNFELTAATESPKKHDFAIKDGGGMPGLYQVGSHIDLTPTARDNGLVGYWKFDEGTGTTAADSTGKWGVATISGAVWSSACEKGNCLIFDGVDDNASVAGKTSLFSSLHGPITVLAWFSPSRVTGNQSIFGDSSPEIQIYMSGVTAYGKAYNDVSMGTVAAGNWYFGAITHDQTTGLIGTTIKTYMNGNPVNQGSWTWSSQNGYANEGYYFGGYSGDSNFFQGSIDEIRIYNRALSADEIKVIYDATK